MTTIKNQNRILKISAMDNNNYRLLVYTDRRIKVAVVRKVDNNRYTAKFEDEDGNVHACITSNLRELPDVINNFLEGMAKR